VEFFNNFPLERALVGLDPLLNLRCEILFYSAYIGRLRPLYRINVNQRVAALGAIYVPLLKLLFSFIYFINSSVLFYLYNNLRIYKLFIGIYLPIDLKVPIKIGTRIRQALLESTLTTSDEVVIVFTISMLFILNVLELFNVLIISPINLYCEFNILKI
jgi:hypothetical protein